MGLTTLTTFISVFAGQIVSATACDAANETSEPSVASNIFMGRLIANGLASPVERTISTEQGALATTLFATLPSIQFLKSLRLCARMKIKSADHFSAANEIKKSGFPRITVTSA